MNCQICSGYLRDKDSCPGCRSLVEAAEKKHLRKCVIRNCSLLKDKGFKFCSGKCPSFPCLRLKNLDKRYRLKYGMSMLENLEFIFSKGIRKFIAWEKKRWLKDGKVFCVHNQKLFKLK